MDSFGARLPHLVTAAPGPASRALARRLREVESRNVTWLADDFPVFWEAAGGANVRDADGNVYLDLTAAFGVSLVGHGAPEVLEALDRQARSLVHGMGDVHPPVAKVRLLEALAMLLPWPDARIVLGTSGSEAVEAALKTGRLASGRPGVIAFHGGYHGMTAGSLAVTARPEFRAPILERLYEGVVHLPFPVDGRSRPEAAGEDTPPRVLAALDAVLAGGTAVGPVGTIVVEPVQARGGVRVLPEAFGRGLMDRVRHHGLVLVADEIYTGLGRCGAVLASPRVGLDPHVVCVGKVLGGGMPLSACAAPAAIMDAWPPSEGEALHTSTFLGHPLSCAAAEAVLGLVAAGLPARAEALGRRLIRGLRGALGAAASAGSVDVRGMGLLIGIEVRDGGAPRPGAGVRVAQRLLERGVIALPAGDRGSVLELSPPVVLTREQERYAVDAVAEAIREEVA